MIAGFVKKATRPTEAAMARAEASGTEGSSACFTKRARTTPAAIAPRARIPTSQPAASDPNPCSISKIG